MERDEILAFLKEFKQNNAERYGILEIGLFGSVARGDAGENSDMDICVKTMTPNPFVLVHIKEDIESQLHRPVDIVRVRDKMNSLLKSRIEKEGVYV